MDDCLLILLFDNICGARGHLDVGIVRWRVSENEGRIRNQQTEVQASSDCQALDYRILCQTLTE